jgi:hypothetical protein
MRSCKHGSVKGEVKNCEFDLTSRATGFGVLSFGLPEMKSLPDDGAGVLARMKKKSRSGHEVITEGMKCPMKIITQHYLISHSGQLDLGYFPLAALR